MTHIQSVPVETLEISDEGLKNLAGWLARYTKLGVFKPQEWPENHSVTILQLLSSGELVKFEPLLEKFVDNRDWSSWGKNADVEEYQFCVNFDGVMITEEGQDDQWADIYLYFKSNDTCRMFILENIENEIGRKKVEDALAVLSEALEVSLEDRDTTWLEADKLILKYVKYKNALLVPKPPDA